MEPLPLPEKQDSDVPEGLAVLSNFDFSGALPDGREQSDSHGGTIFPPSLQSDREPLSWKPMVIQHVNYTNREQYDRLHAAITTKQYETVRQLCQDGNPFTVEIVKFAIEAKDTRALDIFLQNGWDIDMALDYTTPSALALTSDDPVLSTWLLDHGASPNTPCDIDMTPLSCAVADGPMSAIEMLFEAGGSIQHGELLHYAVRRTLPDYLDVLRLILSKGPPINNIMYQENLVDYYRQRMFSLGTPLHEAAARGRLDVAQILIKAGSHPLIRDSRGRTPVERAERNGHHEVVNFLQPITEKATPPEYQFTEGKETDGYS